MKIDASNWLILAELQKNARTPLSDIAKKVKMSSPSVKDRIQKMEDAGIIKGYQTQLNMTAIGYPLCVYISIKIRFGKVKAFEKYIKTVSEICEVDKLTGHDCMMMKGFVRDPEHLEKLNSRLSEYGELTTSLRLKRIVDGRIYDKEF